MSMKLQIDHAAVKLLCERMGIEYDARDASAELRHEVLFWLSARIEALETLATRGSISLFKLSVAGLVPNPFGNIVLNCGNRDHNNLRGLHGDLGNLTDSDCERFRRFRGMGSKVVKVFKIFAELHRQTNGFRTVLVKELNDEEKVALINRVVDGINCSREIRRKVLAFFPPPTP